MGRFAMMASPLSLLFFPTSTSIPRPIGGLPTVRGTGVTLVVFFLVLLTPFFFVLGWFCVTLCCVGAYVAVFVVVRPNQGGGFVVGVRCTSVFFFCSIGSVFFHF